MRLLSWSAVAAMAGLLCSCSLEAAESEKPPESKHVQVKVRVVDTAGWPIAGASVEAWQGGGEPGILRPATRISVDEREVRTGSDGWAAMSFSMVVKSATSRRPNTYFCLTAQAADHLMVRSGPIRPAPSDHFEAVFTLRRLVSVEGRVVDAQGRPVADAAVFHAGNAARRVETRTDAQGRFRLGGLPEGQSPVLVSHPGFHFHGQLLDTAAGPHELKLSAADETPAPLTTLPPLRSHAEELKWRGRSSCRFTRRRRKRRKGVAYGIGRSMPDSIPGMRWITLQPI